MKLKQSEFNSYIENEDYVIIFNSYTYELIKIKKDSNIYKNIIQQEGIEIEENENLKQLVNKGFLVKYDENEKLKMKLHRNDLVMDSRLVFTILTTGQCNFRCKYCYEKFEHRKMSEELADSFIKYIKNNICKYKGVHLRWFGGEPLLGLNIVEKVCREVKEICINNNREFSSEMLTNAYLLDLKTFKKLIELRSNSI